jgi:hypothetical protein
MLPNNFEEWCKEVINQVHQEYDLLEFRLKAGDR